MDNPTIGIRIANGTYFPILKEEERTKKKVVLSPVKENQKDVKIDIFRGDGDGMFNPVYVASLILNNITNDDEKVPEIELLLNVNEDGILDAQATEPISGVKQFVSVSLDSIDNNAGFYDMKDSDDNDSVDEPRFSSDFNENINFDDSESDSETGEDKESKEDKKSDWPYNNEKETKKKGGGKTIVIILIILLLLLLGFLAYSFIMKPALAKKAADDKALQNPPVAVIPEPKEPEPVIPPPEPEPAPVVVAPEPTPPPAEPVKKAQDIRYRIKWGDTLWDISNTYYRTPWLYKKIAKDNKIKNPDLIYAGYYLTIKAE